MKTRMGPFGLKLIIFIVAVAWAFVAFTPAAQASTAGGPKSTSGHHSAAPKGYPTSQPQGGKGSCESSNGPATATDVYNPSADTVTYSVTLAKPACKDLTLSGDSYILPKDYDDSGKFNSTAGSASSPQVFIPDAVTDLTVKSGATSASTTVSIAGVCGVWIQMDVYWADHIKTVIWPNGSPGIIQGVITRAKACVYRSPPPVTTTPTPPVATYPPAPPVAVTVPVVPSVSSAPVSSTAPVVAPVVSPSTKPTPNGGASDEGLYHRTRSSGSGSGVAIAVIALLALAMVGISVGRHRRNRSGA